MEISTKMHLLELSTVIHVVRKEIKCLLVNEDRVAFLLLDYVIYLPCLLELEITE